MRAKAASEALLAVGASAQYKTSLNSLPMCVWWNSYRVGSFSIGAAFAGGGASTRGEVAGWNISQKNSPLNTTTTQRSKYVSDFDLISATLNPPLGVMRRRPSDPNRSIADVPRQS